MGMNTGDISRRLGFPISTPACIAAGLTIETTQGRATIFSEPWPQVCEKLAAYILSRKAAGAVAKPEPKPPKEKAEKPAKAKAEKSKAAESENWEDDDDL